MSKITDPLLNCQPLALENVRNSYTLHPQLTSLQVLQQNLVKALQSQLTGHDKCVYIELIFNHT